MKKRFTWALVLITLVVAGITFVRFSKSDTTASVSYTALQPRKNSLAYPAEWTAMKGNADALLARIKKNPNDLKAMAALIAIYIQEGRITGNLDFYNTAALKMVNDMLARDASRSQPRRGHR